MKFLRTSLALLSLSLLALASIHTVQAQSCDTPDGLTAIDVGVQSVTLTWNDTEGANLYRVRYRPLDGSWSATRVTDNSLDLNGLLENTTYQFQARAICGNQRSTWSAISLFTTSNTTACDMPTGLFTLGIGSLQATLTWQMVTGANSYNARIREVGTTTWTEINGINSNLTIADGLSANSTYEYQVQADCGSSNSDFSESEVFTTLDNVCVPPTNFQVTAVTTNTVSLSWNAVGGANHYLVRYRETGTSDWLLRDFIGSTFVTLTDLFPNTRFEAQIQVDCTLGSTDFTESIFFTTDQISVCEVPQNLNATQISETFATHNWDPVIGALDYTVRRRVAGMEEWTFEHTTTQTSVQTFLLTPGTTYEFQVETHCVIGSSGFSGPAFYTTDQVSTCPIPETLTTSNITDGSAFLNWENLIDASTYTIQHRVDGNLNWTTTNRNFSNLNLTNLIPDTPYEWRVRSNCESINSDYSSIQNFVTLTAGACPIPTGLFVLGITNSSATLTWRSVADTDGYNVRYRETGSTSWTNVNGVASNLLGISNLNAGASYEFQVQAICDNGNSDFSPADTFTTGGALAIMGTSDAPASISSQAHVLIYPNPARDFLNVDVAGKVGEFVSVSIFNSQGNLVSTAKHQLNTIRDSISIPLKLKNQGFYQVVVKSSLGATRQRLILH